MAYVYLLGDAGQDNAFKIGITRNDVQKRIKQLQTGNGEEIYLINTHETNFPFFVERLLHKKLYPKQKRNEWFYLDVDDIVNFKKYCEEIEQTAESLKDNPFTKNILK